MKKELKIIGTEIKEGLSHTMSKLTPKTKTDEDEIISKINKYHSLMKKGIIQESEFESKKTELLSKKE